MSVSYSVFDGWTSQRLPITPRQAKGRYPIFHANGVGDDTDALQAALDGDPFVAPDWLAFQGTRRGKPILYIRAARLRVTTPIQWPDDNPFVYRCDSVRRVVSSILRGSPK